MSLEALPTTTTTTTTTPATTTTTTTTTEDTKQDTIPLYCEEVQPPQFAINPSATPLILIHDGGGTTFPYHCLDPLGRPVYGIANPHYESGQPWPGGIPEMAQAYAGMIRRTVAQPSFPKGKSAGARVAKPGGKAKVKIFLGGWSLGGMLSLEVAKILDDDAHVEILGIVMVDSVCPLSFNDQTAEAGEKAVKKKMGTMMAHADPPKRRTERLAQQAMTNARAAVGRWELPTWSWEEGGEHAHVETGDGASSSPLSSGLVRRHPGGPPPTVLLKATDAVPMKDEDEMSPVDRFRRETVLGWDRYHPDFVGRVLEVEGHHFDIFGFDRVAATSVKVKAAVAVLEKSTT